MKNDAKFTYDNFLRHEAALTAAVEVALTEACEKFEKERGSLAQLDWFSSNPDKHIEADGKPVLVNVG